MLTFDASKHGGDMAVVAIQVVATLRVVPAQAREAAGDRCNGQCLRKVRDVEPDDFGRGGQRV